MSQPWAGPKQSSKRRANEVSMTRNIVGVVVLVIAVSVGIIEVMANQAYNAAVAKVNAKVEEMKTSASDVGPPQPEIETLINRKPDSTPKQVEQEIKATYTWRGVFRSYPLTLYYTTSETPPRLMRVE